MYIEPSLKSSLDRFIGVDEMKNTFGDVTLKSSLDRFIEAQTKYKKKNPSTLKSSLDRFIDVILDKHHTNYHL